MRSLYQPDPNTGALQGLAAPFEFATLQLNDGAAITLDGYNKGKHFPNYAGYGLYVHSTDFPATLTLTNQQTGVNESYTLRNGLEITSQFRGLTIACPSVPGAVARISILRSPGQFTNTAANPIFGAATYGRIVVDTALSQRLLYYVAPGASLVRKLKLNIPGTGLTSCSARPSVNGGFYQTNSILDVRNGNTYALTNPGLEYATITNPAPGVYVAEFSTMWLHSSVDSIYVDAVGTGLSAATTSASLILE